MYKKIILLYITVYIIFSGFVCRGQDNKTMTLNLKTGIGKYAVNDELMSPLVYSKLIFPIGIFYREDNFKKTEILEFQYIGGKLESSSPSYMNLLLFQFNYSYNRFVISILNNSGFIFIGGDYLVSFSLRDQHFISRAFNELNEYKSGEAISAINLSGLFKYDLNEKNKFFIRTIIPVFGYIVRPPYSPSKGWNLFSGKITSINNFFINQTKLWYEKNIGNHFNLSVEYSFNFYTIKFPFSIKSAYNNFNLGIGYSF
ncbi:MAG: hypothetical protein JXB17_10955 [Bacteroidales bacterium]|nr:hypothetical protein [Bacteroidales bacterium]